MDKTKRRFATLLACLAVLLLMLTVGLDDPTGGPDVVQAGETGTINGKVKGKKKYQKRGVVSIVNLTSSAPEKKITYDQRDQKFKPHVLPIVKGTTVSFLNSDATGHNVYSPDHEGYDLGTWEKGTAKDYTFKKLGVYTQLCKLHPSMLGYVVSLPNKWFDKTNKKGKFKIKDVPPGKYTLRFWHEKGKAADVEVTVEAGKTAKVTFDASKK